MESKAGESFSLNTNGEADCSTYSVLRAGQQSSFTGSLPGKSNPYSTTRGSKFYRSSLSSMIEYELSITGSCSGKKKNLLRSSN